MSIRVKARLLRLLIQTTHEERLEIDKEIERIAKKERISVNRVANRALRRFVDWDNAASTRGMVSVPSRVLVKLMESKTTSEARELGRWAGTQLFIPNLKAQFATPTLDQALSAVRMLDSYGGRFGFDHKAAGKKHIVTIVQPMGENWSAYYAGCLEGIFGDYFKKHPRISVKSTMCVCEFEN